MSPSDLRPTLLALAVLAPFGTTAAERDLHDHLIETNRAQIVMLAERAILPADEAARIAAALRATASEMAAREEDRSTNYLDLERRLQARIGPEASNLHIGRSRNDLNAAMNRMILREHLLARVDDIGAVRTRLQAMAGAHLESVMPGFTHAVQAQPTTVAHFLLAFDAGLARDQRRLREIHARINLSPLGAGAFTTSGFPLDRPLLAELLGFDGLVENAYDAIMVSTADSKVEYAAALGLSALGIGRFAQSLIVQYDDPAPGIYLGDNVTSRSSIMPQKRNPSAIERLRLSASEVVANGHASAFFAHNTPLYEVKDVREDHLARLLVFSETAGSMYAQLGRILDGLVIDPVRLRGHVDADYSTMTELADTLLREADVPFRIGYRVASELTTHGRSLGKRPVDLTREEVAAIYRRVADAELPLSEAQLRRAFDPLEIVRARKGVGGPQPAETARMLKDQERDTAANRDWTAGERERLGRASEALGRRFDALADRAR